MQGPDYALRVGRRVVVELIEVRRHKSGEVWLEVVVPKTTAQITILPPHSSSLSSPGPLVCPMSRRRRSVPTFPLSLPMTQVSLFTH